MGRPIAWGIIQFICFRYVYPGIIAAERPSDVFGAFNFCLFQSLFGDNAASANCFCFFDFIKKRNLCENSFLYFIFITDAP